MLKPKSLWIAFAVLWIIAGSMGRAYAVPSLQLYIEGSTYDAQSETWVYPGLEYDLWAIAADPDYKPGNQYLTISDVKLAAAVRPGQTGTITITPLDGGSALVPQGFYEDTYPIKGDGSPLPGHGIYPENDFWVFDLGDFLLDQLDQDIRDYNQNFDPNDPAVAGIYGKVMKYRVVVSGEYDWVHFDLYNHVEGKNHALFAPFSHDADAEDGTPVPEPATMLLVGFGLIGLAGFRKKFRAH